MMENTEILCLKTPAILRNFSNLMTGKTGETRPAIAKKNKIATNRSFQQK